MNTKSFTLQVSSDIGSVSAEAIVPENPYCIITLAHGAGAGMNHAFMVSLANLLAAKGVVTVRFNFPSTENKKGRPDVPAVAHKTIAAAIKSARELFPSPRRWRKRDNFLRLSSSSSQKTVHRTCRTP